MRRKVVSNSLICWCVVALLKTVAFYLFGDKQIWEPQLSDIISFQCTANLAGRLFPFPSSLGLYMLDFVDSNNNCVVDPGLNITTIGIEGQNIRIRIPPYDDSCLEGPPHKPRGLFLLNTAGTIRITTQEPPIQVLKTIMFEISEGMFSIERPWIR